MLVFLGQTTKFHLPETFWAGLLFFSEMLLLLDAWKGKRSHTHD